MRSTISKKNSAHDFSSRRTATKTKSKYRGQNVGTDDVVRELVFLFDSLGLERSHLMDGVLSMGSSTGRAVRQAHPAITFSNLMTVWSQDPEYLDSLGNPMPIRLRGKKPSFTALALRCAPHADASKMLIEMKRLRAVKIDKAGLIHPQSRSISVFDDKRLAAQHTLTALHGFIGTLRHNLISESTNSNQLFHRIAVNHKFDADNLPRFKIWLKRHGQHFLESADNWMIRNAAAETGAKIDPKTCVQVTVGMYLATDRSSK